MEHSVNWMIDFTVSKSVINSRVVHGLRFVLLHILRRSSGARNVGLVFTDICVPTNSSNGRGHMKLLCFLTLQ